MGIRDKPTAPASPWQNGFAERLIGSIRRECVDHILVLGELHLLQIMQSYARHYNDIRTRRSLDKDAPVSRQNSANRKHQITRHPWRTSPPLRPSLSFRHTGQPPRLRSSKRCLFCVHRDARPHLTRSKLMRESRNERLWNDRFWGTKRTSRIPSAVTNLGIGPADPCGNQFVRERGDDQLWE
jgi:hypothetical protein